MLYSTQHMSGLIKHEQTKVKMLFLHIFLRFFHTAATLEPRPCSGTFALYSWTLKLWLFSSL